MTSDMQDTVLFKERIKKIVIAIKHHHNHKEAWELMQKYEFSCELVISSTVKIGLDDLIILIDQNLLQVK